MQTVAKTHPLDDHWRNPFGIQHRFKGCHILGEIVFVNAPKGTQIRAEGCSETFTGVAVNLADAITIVIPCPFVVAVTDRSVVGMHATIVRAFVGKEQRSRRDNTRFNNRTTRGFISVFDHPIAVFFGFPTDHPNDGWTVIGIGATATALIGPSPWWVVRIRMGRIFFPPRSDTLHPLQR